MQDGRASGRAGDAEGQETLSSGLSTPVKKGPVRPVSKSAVCLAVGDRHDASVVRNAFVAIGPQVEEGARIVDRSLLNGLQAQLGVEGPRRAGVVPIIDRSECARSMGDEVGGQDGRVIGVHPSRR